MMSSRAPRLVSVIVPVRNDARRLERCLASIRASRNLPAPLELIVADNGSTDDSAAVAAQAEAQVLPLGGYRVSEVRNRAAAASQGDVLVFIDADHEQHPDWIAYALETLRGNGVAAVGAPYYGPPNGTWVQRAYDAMRQRPRDRQDVEWLGSGSLAIWRRVFDELGGFDATLEACEDVDLCKRVRRHGHRLVADERLVTVHAGDPATLRALFLGELWRGRDNLRVSLRPPVTWAGLPSVLLPVMVLTLLVAGVTGLLFWTRWGLFSAALGILGVASARALRVLPGIEARWPAALLRAYVFATTFEVARALALVARAPHRLRQLDTAHSAGRLYDQAPRDGPPAPR